MKIKRDRNRICETDRIGRHEQAGHFLTSDFGVINFDAGVTIPRKFCRRLYQTLSAESQTANTPRQLTSHFKGFYELGRYGRVLGEASTHPVQYEAIRCPLNLQKYSFEC